MRDARLQLMVQGPGIGASTPTLDATPRAKIVGITRGDSLQQDDPPLFDADILGVLVAQFRNGNPIPLRPLQQTRWAKLTRWLAARSSLMRKAILHWPNFCLRLS